MPKPTAEALRIRKTPIKRLFRCSRLADREVARFKQWFRKAYGHGHDRAAKSELATGIFNYTIGNQEAPPLLRRRVGGEGFVILPWSEARMGTGSGLFWKDRSSLKELLKTRQGNCIAFTSLYCMLAEELGVEARPVNVNNLNRFVDAHITPAHIRGDGRPLLFERGEYTLDPREKGKYLGRLAHKEALITSALDRSGTALYERGRHRAAIEVFDKALAIDPHDPSLLTNKGNALSELGRHEEAIAHYDRALMVDPKSALALYCKGKMLSELGRHDEALPLIRRAVRRYPKSMYLRKAFAEAARKAGKR